MSDYFQVSALLFEIHLHSYNPARAAVVASVWQKVPAFGTCAHDITGLVIEHKTECLDIEGLNDLGRSRCHAADKFTQCGRIINLIRRAERLAGWLSEYALVYHLAILELPGQRYDMLDDWGDRIDRAIDDLSGQPLDFEFDYYGLVQMSAEDAAESLRLWEEIARVDFGT